MDFESIIQNGLPPATKPKKVVIVGAGMAGLTAAYELLRAGHDPMILEARPRVGGRVYTLREPFSPGLYAEAGAMRIPKTHTLTMGYVEKFKLRTSPFSGSNPKAYYFFRGKRYRAADIVSHPDALGFDVAPNERGKSTAQMWEQAIRPITAKIDAKGDGAWTEIVQEYDHFSTREFLEDRGWSEGAIEMFGLLDNQESRLNASFIELLREKQSRSFLDLVELEGGMDNLPRAFLPTLSSHIRFGAKMIAIDQGPDSVTIHYQTLAGREQATGDYAILAVPFPVLRHVEMLPPFSNTKQRAIRQLHYDASAKILFQCRRRFWEDDDGIFGGSTITDLPVRNIYYPEHGRETGRGVLLASYTWAEDAQRWGSLDRTDRLVQAIEDVAQIHPQINETFEVGASQMWHDDEFAGGAFVLFQPQQETLLHQSIIAPEGRIYFAGEHCSLFHRWIQGAVESGLRAASEIHSAP